MLGLGRWVDLGDLLVVERGTVEFGMAEDLLREGNVAVVGY